MSTNAPPSTASIKYICGCWCGCKATLPGPTYRCPSCEELCDAQAAAARPSITVPTAPTESAPYYLAHESGPLDWEAVVDVHGPPFGDRVATTYAGTILEARRLAWITCQALNTVYATTDE